MVDSVDIKDWCYRQLEWDIEVFMRSESHFSQEAPRDATVDTGSCVEARYYRRGCPSPAGY